MRFYAIDAGQLARLRAIQTRLHSEERLHGDEMRDLGHANQAICGVAEQLPVPATSVFMVWATANGVRTGLHAFSTQRGRGAVGDLAAGGPRDVQRGRRGGGVEGDDMRLDGYVLHCATCQTATPPVPEGILTMTFGRGLKAEVAMREGQTRHAHATTVRAYTLELGEEPVVLKKVGLR